MLCLTKIDLKWKTFIGCLCVFFHIIHIFGKVRHLIDCWSISVLEQQKEIATPFKTLYWDYYQYVIENPVVWGKKTALLYGAKDFLCEYEIVKNFADRAHAEMTVLDEGEHFFHTEEQIAFYRDWLTKQIAKQQQTSRNRTA